MGWPDADVTPDLGAPDLGEPDADPHDADAGDVDGASDAGDVDAGDVESDAGDVGDAAIDAGVDAGTPDSGVDKLLAFTSKRDGNNYDIYLALMDGSGIRQLTSSPGFDSSPSWSPFGRHIAFVSDRDGRRALYLLELETGVVQPLVTTLWSVGAPAFSPDGTTVAFEARPEASGANYEVYSVDVATQVLTRLTNAPRKDGGPTWSPDGTTIYFVSNRTLQFEIFSMSANGLNQQQLTTDSGILGRPTVSPDGMRLAYTRLGTTGVGEVVAWTIGTTMIQPLSTQGDSEPFYDPGGRYLVFTTLRFGNPDLVRLDLTTTLFLRLTSHPSIDGAAVITRSLP